MLLLLFMMLLSLVLNLLYQLGIYNPRVKEVLYYPYVENHRDTSKPLTMTQLEWLESERNYNFMFTCEKYKVTDHMGIRGYNCRIKRNNAGHTRIGNFARKLKWCIPEIKLSSDPHDTDIVYYLTPLQAMQYFDSFEELLQRKFFVGLK